MIRGSGRLLAAAVLFLVPACAGPGFELQDLPPARIAIVYRTVDETQKVEERLQGRHTQIRTHRQEVNLQELANVLGLPGSSRAETMEGILGHLAFVDPRTGAVTRAPFAERGAHPEAWSPDHQHLLFRTNRLGSPQIFEWDASSGDVHPVTSLGWVSVGASYGPDGEIAVVRRTYGERGGPRDRIFLLAPGQDPRPVTDGPADNRPRISPDGRILLFDTLDDQGQLAIGSVHLGAGGKHRILARGRDACFTPDGRWIFYSHRTREGRKIWQMRPDGSAKHPFGASGYFEYEPAVSPDGRYLLYLATQKKVDADTILMVRSLATGRDRALVIDGTALDPVW